MRYLSVCSGIEAATVAWHPLGWTPAAFSEIEPFPRAVLAHHYPDVPLHGDFTTIRGDEYGPVQLLVGGTPCQSFSVAGLRKGLADERGNLALEFLRLADRLRARWVVWENVPGVLSSNGGRDFGAFLGGLAELGYGFAYRVLDAQHFGVPQRRRRVFVVGHLGDWRRAAAVLFERHSLSGHPAPRREAGQGAASAARCGFEVGGTLGARVSRLSTDECAQGAAIVAAPTIAFGWQNAAAQGDDVRVECSPTLDKSKTPAIAFSCKDYGQDAGELAPTLRSMSECGGNANGGGQVAVAVDCYNGVIDGDVTATLRSGNGNESGGVPAVAFAENSRAELRLEGGDGSRTGTLNTGGGKPGQGLPMVASPMAVRRITPREAERLQGFPDDYTLVPVGKRSIRDPNLAAKLAADGPRYKALGNSMAVPVMRWIGERIAAVEALPLNQQEAA